MSSITWCDEFHYMMRSVPLHYAVISTWLYPFHMMWFFPFTLCTASSFTLSDDMMLWVPFYDAVSSSGDFFLFYSWVFHLFFIFHTCGKFHLMMWWVPLHDAVSPWHDAVSSMTWCSDFHIWCNEFHLILRWVTFHDVVHSISWCSEFH